jgi:hypothetical protein
MGKRMMANPCCGLQIAKCQNTSETLRKERVSPLEAFDENLEVSPNKN